MARTDRLGHLAVGLRLANQSVMSPSQTMYGVQLVGHGGPEKLVWNERIPVPVPAASEVLVRVLAAGVNNTDINTRIGWYAQEVSTATNDVGDVNIESGGWGGALRFPRIQGGDLCGEVISVGKGVNGIALGMRVPCAITQPMPTSDNPVNFEALGSERDGAFAEFCCVPAAQLYDVSDSPLSDIDIGAMPCAFGTALNLLVRAGVNERDHVLITGASGGVGLAAVQLARQRGAEVTAVSSLTKADAVREAGADTVIGREESLPPRGFSVVVDVVGGSAFSSLLDALRPGGRLATSGAIAGPVVNTDLRTLYLKDLTVFGCTYQPPEVFAQLVNLIREGIVRPRVSQTYLLKEIAKAQSDFTSKHYPGKLVLLP